jgi:hypothetical protein
MPNPGIVDTKQPSLTTKDLISTYETSKALQASRVPANTIAATQDLNSRSNTTPTVPNSTNNNQVMSGQAYPPLSKEYVSLPIPAYEQVGGLKPGANSGTTYQPLTPAINRSTSNSNSNRYPGPFIQQPGNPTPSTYIPIGQNPAQNNSGNSVGYPPGN